MLERTATALDIVALCDTATTAGVDSNVLYSEAGAA